MKDFSSALRSELHFEAVRSRGPGGQNVNKVSSAAIMTWDFNESELLTHEQKLLIGAKLKAYINKEGLLFLRSDERRELGQNKSRCLEKLEDLLRRAFYRERPRVASKPTRASKLKKKDAKTQRSEIKRGRRKVSLKGL